MKLILRLHLAGDCLGALWPVLPSLPAAKDHISIRILQNMISGTPLISVQPEREILMFVLYYTIVYYTIPYYIEPYCNTCMYIYIDAIPQ